MADAPTGQIITFYSYKGGTGRTMALANVAWLLAASGYRVLTVDWDLESPGLHRYFHPFLRDTQLRTTDGVIDMVGRYATAVASGEQPNAPDLTAYAVSLNWDFGDGRLDFIGGGRQDRSYSTVVSTFDWDAFWQRLGGRAYFDVLRQNMRREYDFTLIDSRTGLSDTSGICTVRLPDAVVNCFTLNTQSIDGAAAVARSIGELGTDRKIAIYPIPTRVESGERTKLERVRRHAHGSFTGFLPVDETDAEAVELYWGGVEVPYQPFYAYEEVLAVFGDRPRQEGTLLASYGRLATRLTGRPITAPPLPEFLRERVLRSFELQIYDGADPVFIGYTPVDRLWAEWLAKTLTDAGYAAVIGAAAEKVDLSTFSRVLAIVSKTSRQRMDAWIRDTATDNESPIVPVVVDSSPGVPLATAVSPVLIRSVHSVDKLHSRLGLLPKLPFSPQRERPFYTPNESTTHWQVPRPRNPRFVGRDTELQEMRDLLSEADRDAWLALTGMPGIGKTEIALEYAYRFGAAYHAVIWIDAGENFTGPRDLREQLHVAGRNWAAQPALVIIDRLDDLSLLASLPSTRSTHVVVTCRDPGGTPKISWLPIDVMSRTDSRALLELEVPAIAEADADTLAEAVGDHPLGLQHAVSFLRHAGVTETIRTFLDASGARLFDNRVDGGSQSLTATVRMAMHELRSEAPAAARLVEIAAFLGDEPIPQAVLDSPAMVAALVAEDPKMHNRLRRVGLVRAIARTGLGTVDAKDGSLAIHRVLRALLRDEPHREDPARSRELAWQALASADRGDAADPDAWSVQASLLRHAQQTRAEEDDSVEVRQLLLDLVRFLRYSADAAAAKALADKTLTSWRARDARDDVVSLRLRGQRASAARDLGDWRSAEDEHRAVWSELRAALGDTHSYTEIAANHLGETLLALGVYNEAFHILDQASRALDGSVGANHSTSLAAGVARAVAMRLSGDPRTAHTTTADLVDQMRALLGSNHLQTLAAEVELGRALRSVGRLRESAVLMTETVKTARNAAGEGHPTTIRAMVGLSVTLRRLGEPQRAAELVSEAAGQSARRLGLSHPDTLACRLEHACVLHGLGQTRDARKLAEEVFRDFSRQLGHDHPATLVAAVDLGIFLLRSGEHQEARGLADETLDRLRRTLGEDHPYTVVARLGLSNVLFAGRARAKARQMDEQVLRRARELFDGDHPITAAATANLAVSRIAEDDGPEAERLRAEAESSTVAAFGAFHGVTEAAREGRRVDVDLEAP